MLATGLLLSYLLAITLTLLMAVGLRGHYGGRQIVIFFLVVLLASWAGGVWLPPIGPLLLDVPWLSFLLAAVAAGLLMTAILPDGRRPARRAASPPHRHNPIEATAAIDILSWMLIVAFAIAIVIRYYIAA